MAELGRDDFWDPQFEITHREDGSILMRQTEELQDYLPTLADYLDHWAQVAPDRMWMARRGEDRNWIKVTYAQAKERALSLGASLLALGLSANKPLLILSENSLEHALLGLACFNVGIPYAPVSPAYSLVSQDHAKLKNIANLLEPGAVFADDGAAFAPACASIALDGMAVINARNFADGSLDLNDLPQGDMDAATQARQKVDADTVVKYLFTSGSTGSPKAVINTNGMLTASQAMVRDAYRFLSKSPPVLLDWAPWNHTASGNKASYLCFTNGGSYYIDDGRPTKGKFDETLNNLKEISPTWYFNVPIGFDMLAGALEEDDALAEKFFSQLGMLFYAGAGMAQHTWDKLSALGKKWQGKNILLATGLGSTETSPFALACTDILKEAGNVGVPSRGLIMKLVPNGGKLELRLKGPTIMPGYFKDEDNSKAAFDDEGFYCMGDALRPADPDDFAKGFFFDGRIAENFKLQTGTWVAVGAVRAAIVDHMEGLIRDAVIVGENETELGALLLLSESGKELSALAKSSRLSGRLVQAARVATGSASRIRRAMIIDEEPSFDRGEVTEKGSLNQRQMRVSHADKIAKLYADEGEIFRA